MKNVQVCLRLAKKISQAVDFTKTGLPPEPLVKDWTHGCAIYVDQKFACSFSSALQMRKRGKTSLQRRVNGNRISISETIMSRPIKVLGLWGGYTGSCAGLLNTSVMFEE